MLFAPLEGWRRVGVTDRRTKVDWAHQVKSDEDYPDKDRIVLVMDNLRTPMREHPASLYEAFEPMEALPQSGQYRPTSGDSLHPQAWELAGHG